MKVFFGFPVNTHLLRGDSIHVKNLISALKKKSFNFDVYTYDDVRSRTKYLKILEFRINLLKKYFSSNYSKIYLRYFPGLFLDIILLKLFRKNLIIEVNAVISDEAVDLKFNPLIKAILLFDEYLLKNTKINIVAVTPEIKNFYQTERNDVIFISNGVNLQLMQVTNSRFNSAFEDIANNNNFIVGFVGTLSPWQDFETLLNAIKSIILDQEIKNIKLHIIGSGIMESFIKNFIIENKLSDNIVLFGSVHNSEIPKFIDNFDIAVAPLRGSRLNKTGSSALKVFEYLAMNKFVLITECGSLSNEIVINGFGLKCKKEDPKDFAKNILFTYNNRPVIYSRDYIEKMYSWDTKINKLEKILFS